MAVAVVVSGCSSGDRAGTDNSEFDPNQPSGQYFITITRNDTATVFSTTGENLVSFPENEVVNSLFGFDGGYGVLKKDGKYQIVSVKGEVTFESEKEIKKFAPDAYEVINEERDHGLVDHSGKVIVDYGKYRWYNYESSLNDRRSDVKYIIVENDDDTWGIIDEYGKVLVEPTNAKPEGHDRIETSARGNLSSVNGGGKLYMLAFGQVVLSTDHDRNEHNLRGSISEYRFTHPDDYGFFSNSLGLYVVHGGQATRIEGWSDARVDSGDLWVLYGRDVKDGESPINGQRAIYDPVEGIILSEVVFPNDHVDVSFSAEGPLVIDTADEPMRKVLTKHGMTEYQRLGSDIHPLGSGYYAVPLADERIDRDITKRTWGVFNYQGHKVLETVGHRRDWLGCHGMPTAAMSADDKTVFAVFDADDCSIVHLLDDQGNTIQSFPDTRNATIKSWKGHDVGVVRNEYFSLLRAQDEESGGRILIDSTGEIVLEGYLGDLGGHAEAADFAKVKVDGRIGVYSFATGDFLIEPAFDSIRYDNGFFIWGEVDKHYTYFALNGVELV